jgi:hypothetical protein
MITDDLHWEAMVAPYVVPRVLHEYVLVLLVNTNIRACTEINTRICTIIDYVILASIRT